MNWWVVHCASLVRGLWVVCEDNTRFYYIVSNGPDDEKYISALGQINTLQRDIYETANRIFRKFK